jgi:hypothetical protein
MRPRTRCASCAIAAIERGSRTKPQRSARTSRRRCRTTSLPPVRGASIERCSGDAGVLVSIQLLTAAAEERKGASSTRHRASGRPARRSGARCRSHTLRWRRSWRRARLARWRLFSWDLFHCMEPHGRQRPHVGLPPARLLGTTTAHERSLHWFANGPANGPVRGLCLGSTCSRRLAATWHSCS